MTTYILLKTSMTGTNPEIVTSSADYSGRLAAFGNYCSLNNIAIVNWTYRTGVGAPRGMFAASEMSDETNYNLFQVYSLDDWEGDPEANFWVNDIAMFRWIELPAAPEFFRVTGVDERKTSEHDWVDGITE